MIDFINMILKTDRYRLIEQLEKIFANDAGIAQIHGFTRLGIVEMTRKRRGATLLEKMGG